MKDFTLKAYKSYLEILSKKDFYFSDFRTYLSNENKPSKKICLVRHDVDRKPTNALEMAQLEQSMGITSTYYFRTKPATFKKDIIRSISGLGHEIGYHYETLSDTRGDINKAVEIFSKELDKLRTIVPINTVSMHGRPLLPYDNRDIWRDAERHNFLISNLSILGEVYLDIDYSNIAYISDTGRNWTNSKSNKRDKVNSNINTNFNTTSDMVSFLNNPTSNTIVFQIHPERWSSNFVDYTCQYLKDSIINVLKRAVK